MVAVAAPNALTVTSPVLNKVNVPVELLVIVGSAPLILNVVAFGNVTVVFLNVAVPVDAPSVKFVAAPNALTVVATVFHKYCVVAVPLTVELLRVVVLESLPIFNVFALPNALTVVATVFHKSCVVAEPLTVEGFITNVPLFVDPRLIVVGYNNRSNDDWFVVMSPPRTSKSPVKTVFPVTFKFPPSEVRKLPTVKVLLICVTPPTVSVPFIVVFPLK